MDKAKLVGETCAGIAVENEGFYYNLRDGAGIRATPRFSCDIGGRCAFLTRDVFAAERRSAEKTRSISSYIGYNKS